MNLKGKHPIKIGIVDKNQFFREILKTFLNKKAAYEVVIVAESAQDVLYQIEQSQTFPDLILLDVKMKGTDGIKTAKLIKKQYPDIPILGISNYDHEYIIAGMLAAGASGFLAKGSKPSTYFKAMKTVSNGGVYVANESRIQKNTLIKIIHIGKTF